MLPILKSPRIIVSRLAALAAAGLFAFTAAAAFAQNDAQVIVPNRITQTVNQDVRVTLGHNVHPMAQARYDQGAAPGSMTTGRIMLVLKRSDTQETALRQYLGDLQNPNSANYRKWLTPPQMGKLYGISDTDMTTVTAWLQSNGFKIEKIPQARNVIEFSGNVAQIQQAFNTSIHRYVINGDTHFANSTDPQIPAALAPVIAGVASLNDFRPKPGAIVKSKARFDKDSNQIKPDLTLLCSSSGCALPNGSGGNVLFATAADAAIIYDTPNTALNPKYTGTTYDGTGVTIGIAGDSNITPQDVALYRAAFLPPNYSSNQPTVIIDGNDPGINNDAIEALLDLEVSGGIAPGASINFYTGGDTDFQSGLFLAIFRALDDNAVSILNVSFGSCEESQGTAGNQQILEAWEQAAAQGMSVTVSTGDSGSAACDNSNAVPGIASNGLAVSGLASTPYNIAVGGTDYDVLLNSFSTYVNANDAASSYYRTALGYIPESPWNDSPKSNSGGYTTNTPFTDSKGNTNIAAAGGGISNCTQTTTSGNNVMCVPNSGYATPPFQTGLPGSLNFNFGSRALPDISLLAADGGYNALWTVCSDSNINGLTTPGTDCEQTSGTFTSGTTFTGVGGTSAAAPAFAGILALVLQEEMARTGNASLRLGQANNVLYNLAAQNYAQIFHDVTTGNNSVVCQSGSLNCGSNGFITGYNAGAGYDAATGLGSVDVAQLISNWKNAVFVPTTTALTISGNSASIPHGTQLTLNATVSPNIATGDVSFINNSGVENNGSLVPEFATLSSGSASLTTGDLPGGTYNVYAYYGGDVKNAPSKSTVPVQVTITPESSQVALGAFIYDPLTGNTLCDDFSQNGPSCVGVTAPYGYVTSVSAQVQGGSGSNTVASGTIAFSDSVGNLTYNGTAASPINVPISSNGIASYNNYQFQNQSLSVASNSHNISASFNGDPSYSASNSGGVLPIKVAQGQTQVVAAATQSGTTVTLQAQVNTDSVGLAPTGTVTFKNGSTTLGTVSTSSTTGFVTNGTGQGQTVAALYQLQVSSSQISSSVKTANLNHGFFPWKISGGLAVMSCVFLFAIPARRRSWRTLLGLIVFACIVSSMIACGGSSSNSGGGGGGGGTGTITAVYGGDTNYSSSTSAAVTVTVTQ